MFQTFTGSSRRPRNVNLSGQKNDPFAANAWSPSASGASQTVSNAAAERQQRQQERQKLHASKKLQRVWRGHRERRELALERREELEALYRQSPPLSPEARISQALPLLLASFNSREQTSRAHLDAYVQDVLVAGIQPLANAQVHPSRLRSLAEILVTALEQRTTSTPTEGISQLLAALAYLVEYHPALIVNFSVRYYSLLATLGRTPEIVQSSSQAITAALTCPLKTNNGRGSDISCSTYQSFAFSFLTTPDLLVLEGDPSRLSTLIDAAELASAIQAGLPQGSAKAKSSDDLLWLLSHFIALGRSASWGTKGSQYLETLYAILHTLTSENQDILSNVGRSEAAGEESAPSTPSYVENQIRSLVDTQGISDLLHKITTDYTSSLQSREFANASLLAGFTLTLLRAFPSSGDEIRMRLFLGNAASDSKPVPSIHFFWKAVTATSIYTDLVSGKRSAADLIRTDKLSPRAQEKSQILRHEWKTILLFLELYVFLLRLTDDDDFFGVMNPSSGAEYTQSSRVRSCNLQFGDVKDLTIFLKNLAFSLYYDAAEILRSRESAKSSSIFLSTYLETGSSGSSQKDTSSQEAHFASLTALLGVGFHAFRDTVANALRMLYERDSRRPFLPANHWLMTSRFDMEGFISAVVAEEQRQQELRAEGGDVEDVAPEDNDESITPFTIQTIRISRHARIEALREQQKRTHRERMLAVIGPKLEVLRNMPFVIPFETRVQIFRQFVSLDKFRRRDGHVDPDTWRMAMMNDNGIAPRHARHAANIRRKQLFDDAFDQFFDLGDELKEPISITFVDQFGSAEAGIDGGGVTKEFLTSVTKEAFSMADGNRLFASNSQNLLYPSPTALDERREILAAAGYGPESQAWRAGMADLTRRYEFLGRIVGKCMYEGILIDVAFAGFFLLKWASSGQGGTGESSYRSNVNDLRELDEELYQGMIRLKNYNGDVSDLAQDFTILDQVSLPGEPIRTSMRTLIPGGQDMMVTNENRPLYISYVARHRLVVQPYQQTKAFLKGLGSIIEPSWLSMFNQNELQRLIGGDSSMIDVEDLRQNTEYSGVYQIGDDGEEHETIKLFWEVMHDMTDSERRDVVKYVTSTPRAPLLGFSQLNPRFTIRDSSQDEERLPSTSTCVNLLKLPRYTSKQRLRDKLLYATQSGAGFDLS